MNLKAERDRTAEELEAACEAHAPDETVQRLARLAGWAARRYRAAKQTARRQDASIRRMADMIGAQLDAR